MFVLIPTAWRRLYRPTCPLCIHFPSAAVLYVNSVMSIPADSFLQTCILSCGCRLSLDSPSVTISALFSPSSQNPLSPLMTSCFPCETGRLPKTRLSCRHSPPNLRSLRSFESSFTLRIFSCRRRSATSPAAGSTRRSS